MMRSNPRIFIVLLPAVLLLMVIGTLQAQTDPFSDSVYLYYFESDDAVLLDRDTARYTFGTLPGEDVTIVVYGLDELVQPDLMLYKDGDLVDRGIQQESQPFLSYIQFRATENTLYEFVVRRTTSTQGIVRVMLFEGEPLDDDLTLLDDINPLLPGRAFMVAGDDSGEGLRTLIEVLDVERFDEKPHIFSSRATLGMLPPLEERYAPDDVFLWFNKDGDAIYTFSIRATPEVPTSATQALDVDYRRFNLNTFFYFDYYFTVGAGSDPVRLAREDECAYLLDRDECLGTSTTAGRDPALQDPDFIPDVPLLDELDAPAVPIVPLPLEERASSGLVLPPPPEIQPCTGANAGVVIDLSLTGETEAGGTDCPDTIIGSANDDNIAGFGDSDLIKGGAGNDTLRGGGGNDKILPGPGNDIVDGEDGVDEVDYSWSTSAVTVDLTDTALPGGGTATYDSYTDVLLNIENVTGTGLDDTLTGSDAANRIIGGLGNDTIYTGGGNDVVYGDGTNLKADGRDEPAGPGGNDIFYIGDGRNIVYGDSGDDEFHIQGTQFGSDFKGGQTSWGPYGSDTYYFYDTTQGNFTIFDRNGDRPIDPTDPDDPGDSSVDTLDFTNISRSPGETGITAGFAFLQPFNVMPGLTFDVWGHVDVIEATNGDDTLLGPRGSESDRFFTPEIKANGGNDLVYGFFEPGDYDGGSGIDTIIYRDVDRSDSGRSLLGAQVDINLAAGTATVTGLDMSSFKVVTSKSTISNFENAIGGYKSDTLIGDAGNNVLDPGTSGNDILDGAGGVDTASFESRTSAIDASLLTGTASGAGTVNMSNIENLLGTRFSDVLQGDAGDNTLNGAAGNDILLGSGGNDTLIGGDGRDTASYQDANGGGSSGPLTVTLDYPGISTVAGSWGTDSLQQIEEILADTTVANNDTFNIRAGGVNTTVASTLNGGAGADIYTVLGGATGYVNLVNNSLDNVSFVDTPVNWNPSNTTSYQDIYGDGSLYIKLSAALNANCGLAGFDNPIVGAVDIANNDSTVFDRSLALCDSNDLYYGNDTGADRGDDTVPGIIDEVDYSLVVTGAEQLVYTVDAGFVSVTGTGAINIGTDRLYDVERIIGNAGTDRFVFSGAYTPQSVLEIDGLNSGDDILDFSITPGTGINLDLTQTGVLNPAGAIQFDLLSDFVTVIGTDQNDTIISDNTADILWDNGGTDAMTGNGGDDTFIMENDGADDTVNGGAGIDTVDYSQDTSSGTGSFVFELVTGADSAVQNGVSIDTLTDVEVIIGGVQSDSFNVDDATGYTILDGGNGFDTFRVDWQTSITNLTLIGNNGTDRGIFETTEDLVVDLDGIGLDEVRSGAGGTYTLETIENIFTDEGNDQFLMTDDGVGNSLNAGTGTDTLDYSASTAALNLVLNGINSDATVSGTTDSFLSFENFVATGASDLIEVLNDTGVLSIDAGALDDVIDFETMTQNGLTVDGGTGIDEIGFSTYATGLTLTQTSVTNGTQAYTLTGIENFTGSQTDDNFDMVWDATANVFDGDSGTDILAFEGNTATLALLNINYTTATDGTVDNGAVTDNFVDMEIIALKNTTNNDDTFYVNTTDATTIDGGGETNGDTVIFSAGLTSTIDVTLNNSNGTTTDGLILNDIENVTGGGGDDIIRQDWDTDTENNTFGGGDGSDTLIYTTTGADLTVTVNDGNGTVTDGTTTDTIQTMENIFTGDGDDTFNTVWDAVSNTFDGNGGVDRLTYTGTNAELSVLDVTFTGPGDGEITSTVPADTTLDTFLDMEVLQLTATDTNSDTFYILDEAITTTLDGGVGNDGVVFSDATTTDITATLTGGTGTANGVSLTSIENLTTGGGNDSITQNWDSDNQNNQFDGAGGTDTVTYNGATDLTVNLTDTTGTVTDGTNTDSLENVENVTTGTGNDTFVQDADTDTVDNTFNGDAGTDTVTYTGTTDMAVNLTGDTGSATGAGNDTLTDIENVNTGDGNDTITQDWDSDNTDNQFDGNAGSDTVTYTGTTDLTVTLDGGDETVTDGTNTDTLTDIENVATGAGNDNFLIDINNITGNLVLNAGGGANTFGFQGSNTGGAGVTVDIQTDDGSTDTLDFSAITGAGGVTLDMADTTNAQDIFGNGSFFIRLNNAINNVLGTAQDDDITGTDDRDVIDTGDGDDVVVANDGDDEVTGGTGDDEVTGGTGDDDIDGGAGNDVITGGDDVTVTTPGSTVDVGNAGNDTINGGAGDDDIVAGHRVDCDPAATGVTVNGNDDDNGTDEPADGDTVYGGTGADTIHGDSVTDCDIDNTDGDDDDLYGGNDNTDDANADADDGVDTINGDEGDDEIYGGNNNSGSGTAGDDNGDDVIDGGTGDDDVYGGNNNTGSTATTGGNDTGNDTVNGGTGNDQVYGGNNNTGATGTDIGNDTGTDTVNGDDDTDQVYGGNNNTNMDAAGSGNDAGDTSVNGGAGDNDQVYGGNNNTGMTDPSNPSDAEGNDGGDTSVSGGAGNDTVYGGNNNTDGAAGDNNGDDGNDIITDTTGTDTVYGGNNNTDTSGTGANNVSGDAGNDTVQTNDADDADTVVTGNNNTGGSTGDPGTTNTTTDTDAGDTVTDDNVP